MQENASLSGWRRRRGGRVASPRGSSLPPGLGPALACPRGATPAGEPGVTRGTGGRGGTRRTWGTWRRLRSSEQPKVAPFCRRRAAGVRGAGREPPSGVSAGLRLSARSDPGPSALPSLPGTRGRPRLPPAPELGAPSARLLARRRARSRAARPSQESGLAPRRGSQGELDRFAGAGSGAGWRRRALGARRARSGRARKGPAKATRTGSRESGRGSAHFRFASLGLCVWLRFYWWFGVWSRACGVESRRRSFGWIWGACFIAGVVLLFVLLFCFVRGVGLAESNGKCLRSLRPGLARVAEARPAPLAQRRLLYRRPNARCGPGWLCGRQVKPAPRTGCASRPRGSRAAPNTWPPTTRLSRPTDPTGAT